MKVELTLRQSSIQCAWCYKSTEIDTSDSPYHFYCKICHKLNFNSETVAKLRLNTNWLLGNN